MATSGKPYDLLVVLDATGSMGQFITALNKSLPEIISLSALTGCFERIGVIAYRDYCGGELTEWSEWCSPSGAVTGPEMVSQDRVLEMAKSILADYGGDWPEATKTGLARAYEQMRPEAETIILLYTDAPPHFSATAGSNWKREKAALQEKDSYGGTGHMFADWIHAAKAFASGPKKGTVFSIVAPGAIGSWSPYLYLSAVTGGSLFSVVRTTSDVISNLTLGILLTWMGAGKAVADDARVLGEIKSYIKMSDATGIKDEKATSRIDKYYATGMMPQDNCTASKNIKSTRIGLKDIPTKMKTRGPSVKNFAKRYVDDEAYKKLAVKQLYQIIESNVSTISVNPIFGTLWRTVCNDRANEDRDGLITKFSVQVDLIKDADEKARMKAWLEESYNYAAELRDLIAKVPAGERFPLVFLDPTADFKVPAGENDEDNRPLNEFTRAELLEIGRSCDYRILRRLGKVLTRLTYVEKEADLPAHIRSASLDNVPQIPMVLADPKYNRKFWKILLHAVLPGTMITARPASVLAALALRMGILPLRDVADQELLTFREKWNTLDIPETWNVGCLSLLLDADKDYEARITNGVTKRSSQDIGILRDEDRKLFKTLVDYKMLEMNLKTTLQAKISWKPEKAKVALGPVVDCRKCHFPRSVTMMAAKGVCGICTIEHRNCKCLACTPTADHDARKQNNVSKDHSDKSVGYWVECSRVTCRAQYVVYNPDALRVRAKCFYCRHEDGKSATVGAAPLVECSKCLSRVIWPKEYRPRNLDLSVFECSACTADVVTIITQDTSAEELTTENGNEWLLRNDEKAIPEPFKGRSLFYTAAHCNLAHLPEKVEILPSNDKKLYIAGKLVRNEQEVKSSLSTWVTSRRTEAGVCSLCFSNTRKDNLRRACGRTGCHQLICPSCITDWYGLNARGRILNMAALSCPFCRRRPAPKTLSPFGIAQMGNLRSAVDEAGSWIYAWCGACGFAKQYVERACAAGAPPELSGWRCDACKLPEAAMVKQRLCPGCGVATEKMGGCDHITCPCGTHWCYACGKDVGPDRIYQHIGMEHGGLYYGDEEEEDYEDE